MSLTGTISPAGKGTKSAPETKVSGLPLRSTENVRARLEIQNLGFGGVFCILLPLLAKKYAAGEQNQLIQSPVLRKTLKITY